MLFCLAWVLAIPVPIHLLQIVLSHQRVAPSISLRLMIFYQAWGQVIRAQKLLLQIVLTPPASGPVDQSAIDAILAGLGAGESTNDNAGESAGAGGAEPESGGASSLPPKSGPVDQSAIDDILSSMGVGDSTASNDNDQADSQILENAQKSKKLAPAATSGSMNQASIDSLLEELNADTQAVLPPAEDPPSALPDGPLGQDSIDALLSQLSGDSSESEKPATASVPQSGGASSDPVTQSGIDALLSEMGVSAGSTEPAPSEEDVVEAVLDDGQEDEESDALTNQPYDHWLDEPGCD